MPIFILYTVFSSIFIGVSFAKKNNSVDGKLNEKIDEEFKYMEEKISNIMLSLNNLDTSVESDKKNIDTKNSQEDETQKTPTTILVVKDNSILSKNRNEINWDYIESELEEILNNWAVILIDVNSVSDSNENLLELYLKFFLPYI